MSVPHRVLFKAGDQYVIETWDGASRGPVAPFTIDDDPLLVAVVRCDSTPELMGDPSDLADRTDEDRVAKLCPRQKVLVHEQLRPQTDRLSDAVDLAGYYQMPQFDFSCDAGQPEWSSDHTLGQILTQMGRVARAHFDEHGHFPRQLGELPDEALPPPDPWGQRFLVEDDGAQWVVSSSGPDKRANTADDIVLMTKGARIHSETRLTFPGVPYSPSGDYREFVKHWQQNLVRAELAPGWQFTLSSEFSWQKLPEAVCPEATDGEAPSDCLEGSWTRYVAQKHPAYRYAWTLAGSEDQLAARVALLPRALAIDLETTASLELSTKLEGTVGTMALPKRTLVRNDCRDPEAVHCRLKVQAILLPSGKHAIVGTVAPSGSQWDPSAALASLQKR